MDRMKEKIIPLLSKEENTKYFNPESLFGL